MGLAKGLRYNVVIPAAGFQNPLIEEAEGTPYKKIVQETPKALIAIGEKPVVEYTLDCIEDAGLVNIDYIAITTNEWNHPIFGEWLERKRKGSGKVYERVELLNSGSTEKGNQKGTIGSIVHAMDEGLDNESLLVFGGDKIMDSSRFHLNRFKVYRGSAPVTAVHRIDMGRASRHGVVELSVNHKILDFEEKPEEPKTNTISILWYRFPDWFLGEIRSLHDEDIKDPAGMIFQHYHKEFDMYGFPTHHYVHCVGSLRALVEAEMFFEGFSV